MRLTMKSLLSHFRINGLANKNAKCNLFSPISIGTESVFFISTYCLTIVNSESKFSRAHLYYWSFWLVSILASPEGGELTKSFFMRFETWVQRSVCSSSGIFSSTCVNNFSIGLSYGASSSLPSSRSLIIIIESTSRSLSAAPKSFSPWGLDSSDLSSTFLISLGSMIVVILSIRQPTFVSSLTVFEFPVLLQWRGYLIHSMWFLMPINPSVSWSLERSSIIFSSYPISKVPNLVSSLASLHIDSFKFSPGTSSFSSKLAIDIILLRSGFPNISSLNPASLWNSLDSLRF